MITSLLDPRACRVLARFGVLGFVSILLAAGPAGALPKAEVAAAVDRLLGSPALEGGVSGVLVERAGDGEVVYEHDADTRLMPASNRKLFSSAAGLAILGKSFTFQTQALSSAPADARGVVSGDVTLKGGGDSTILTSDLAEMADQLWGARRPPDRRKYRRRWNRVPRTAIRRGVGMGLSFRRLRRADLGAGSQSRRRHGARRGGRRRR